MSPGIPDRASQRFTTPSLGAPRPWVWLLLVLGVLLTHLWLLRTASTHLATSPSTSAPPAPTFITRSIAAAPPIPTLEEPAVAPLPPPLKKPDAQAPLKPKVAKTQSIRAQDAIENIATPEPFPPQPETAPADTAPVEPPNPDQRITELPPPAPTEAASAQAQGLPPTPEQTVAVAVKLPPSTQLNYRVTGGAKGLNYFANSELTWQNTGTHYEARMTVSAFLIGSRSMSSQGDLHAEGLAPVRFADKYKSEVAAHFEPEKGQVSFSANTPTLPWVKGMQDRVSVFFQLGGMLAATPQDFTPGSTIAMITVGPRDADGWVFIVQPPEKLVLPFGELDTIKLSRRPRKEFDQQVEIWYAPQLDYLPVRSKITQANGDFVDQQLSSIQKIAP